MTDFLPGTEVIARGLRWEVVETSPLGEQDLIRLKSLGNSFFGLEIDLLNPLEEIIPITKEINPENAGPFNKWLLYHQAFILEQALGSNLILNVQPGRLKIEPYQLVPLMRALKMTRPRLLLCDDVGLGKTIQAAFILTELMVRRLAHRVLIVSPAGPLLQQWRLELLDRFGIRAEVIDRSKIEEVRKKSELGANPFDHLPIGLISIDFLKQENILTLLERTSYDIIIIDEAHHCSETGGVQDYDSSQRRKLAKVLAERCEVLLLLTATPHNGYDRSFASLLELLDNSLVNGKGQLRGQKYKSFVVRRLKKHIKDPLTGEPKFKEREVIPIKVQVSEGKYNSYIKFQKTLLNFIAPELKKAFKSKNYSDVLAFITLLKRSVSSVKACTETLNVILDRFKVIHLSNYEKLKTHKDRIKTLKQYSKKMEQFGSISYEEEQGQHFLVAEDIAEYLSLLESEVKKIEVNKPLSIRNKLESLLDLAKKALDNDPKINILLNEIENIRLKETTANIIIFTEYTDTQEVIIQSLKDNNFKNILKMSGGESETDRVATAIKFTLQENMILVSTDAAAEGLNLQNKCHHLIHFELPFNPNRLEQRNGRIDRYGQELNPVIRYLYLNNTFEERILLKLIAKYEKQKTMLSFVPNTLGIVCSSDLSYAKLLKGLMNEDENLFKDNQPDFDFYNPEDDKTSDSEIKELLEEIDHSFKGFEKTAKENPWLSDFGINADVSSIDEADRAKKEGAYLANVDLVDFVCKAITIDGGKVVSKDEIIEITLPQQQYWTQGIECYPGYDLLNNVFRLTSNIEILKDEKDNSVGYLGRTHPILLRSINRVRNISFGSSLDVKIENRASAIELPNSELKIICTFVGIITTRKGKIFEKVFALSVNRDGKTEEFMSNEDWFNVINSGSPINPKDLWNRNFSSWGKVSIENISQKADGLFKPMAVEFIGEKTNLLDLERTRLNEWFNERIFEITGEIKKPEQFELFNENQHIEKSSNWISINDPNERISSFTSDRNNNRAKIAEAETLIRLHKARKKELEDYMLDIKFSVINIGILMILPRGI